ncbi:MULTISPECIES: SRPBCC domain-containing protein [Cellulosimicrobium]|uniref:SRPBCC domain-containing protein n=1 Tax=Cellulosimicrobium sp. ES-005 TaxID=3163031 RepID=A0AAU8G5I2_9MICO|nr:SRPBCC domain-containing protein [Cellulosimicrobium cellulans]MCO7272118.1 SRPBCC domain-containing protein [Cellulosimicrobium cellulans]
MTTAGAGRVDEASRLVAAAPRDVYRALVDRDALAAWLPPDGMSGRFERFDLRPGGGYRMVLAYDDPQADPGKTGEGTDVVDVAIVDLVPGRRVVQQVDFASDDPAFAGTMTMTWTVEPADDGARVTVRATGVPSGISPEDHATGMASSLAHLDAHVTSRS